MTTCWSHDLEGKLRELGAYGADEVRRLRLAGDLQLPQSLDRAYCGRDPGVVDVSQVHSRKDLEGHQARGLLQNREEAIDGALAAFRMAFIVENEDSEGGDVLETGGRSGEDEVVKLEDGIDVL